VLIQTVSDMSVRSNPDFYNWGTNDLTLPPRAVKAQYAAANRLKRPSDC